MNKPPFSYALCICIALCTSVLPGQALNSDSTGSLPQQEEAVPDQATAEDSAIWDDGTDEDNPWLPVKDLLLDPPQKTIGAAASDDSSQINESAEIISLPDTASTFTAIDSATAAPDDSSQINESAEIISLPDTASTFTAIDSATAASDDSSQINESAETISPSDTANTFSIIDSADTNAFIVRMLDSLYKTFSHAKHISDTMYTSMQAHFDEIQSYIEQLDKKQLQENDSLYAEFTALKKNYKKMYKRLARFQNYHRDRWAIGYEEGPAFRWRFKSDCKPQKRNRGLSIGIGYQLNQVKDNYHRALHEGHLRIGAYQEFAVFSRVRIAAYFDAMEKMKQMEAEPLMFETTFNRYALWITTLRTGVQINLFSLKHFLLTYRFGFEFSYSTPPYIVNSSKTTFTKYGRGIFRYGISGSDLSALEMIINNIGIYIYF